MTCHGCRSEERCPFCGHVGPIDHRTLHDISETLPTTGRKMKEETDV